MIEAARDFVPAADEVWRLQRGSDGECAFFRGFADRGHYRGEGGTRQGIYAVTPSGELLASANTLDADEVLELLARAREAWAAAPPEARRAPPLADVAPALRWEEQRPAGGLALVCTARDLPAELDPGAAPLRPSNTDHVWASRGEALALGRGDGDAWRELVLRLARFHLVDVVRGQALPFAPEEVGEVAVAVERLADGRLLVRGSTRAAARGPWLMEPGDWTPEREFPHAVATRFLGYAEWDGAAEAFRSLELVALGTRSGRTENNGREADGAGPIGFWLRLAEPGDDVPPAFVDVYGVPWLERR